jgi:hypothetical protein
MENKKRKPKEFRINQIRNVLKEGITSIEEFEAKTGLGILTARGYAIKGKIKLPFSRMEILDYVAKTKPVKRFPERDELIRKHLSVDKMSSILNLPKETLHQYIIKSGQHKSWSKEREKISGSINREKRETLGELVSIINKGIEKNLKEDEKWAYEKAMQYRSLKKVQYSFRRLFGIFKKYDQAKGQGKKLTLSELGEDFGINEGNLSSLLKKAEVAPHNGTRTRITIPKHIKEAIDRSIEMYMNGEDKAYLLRVPNYVVNKQLSSNPNKHLMPKANNFIFTFKKTNLTRRLASQIYEAQDLDFSKSETMELLDIPEEVYNYAINNRKSIGGEIINALKIFYPEKNITKPYINFK